MTEARKRHTRRLRDTPPLDHEMESYFSGVEGLILGYELRHEPSLLAEVKTRTANLAMDRADVPFDGTASQARVFAAIDRANGRAIQCAAEARRSGAPRTDSALAATCIVY